MEIDLKNRKSKAAILTWCYNNGRTNYGQVLQCYAMQTMVRRFGYDTKVIKYRERNAGERMPLDKKSEKYIGIYELCYRLGVVEGAPSVRIFRFAEFIKENIVLSNQCYTKHDVEQECEDADVLFCGSDQIWNPRWFKDVYALNFGRADQKRIAYAASGAFIENPQTELVYKELGGYLNRFDLVTVREKASIDILRKYTERKIVDVADPTLLLSQDEWNQVAAKPIAEEPYIFCYCLGRIRGYKQLLKRVMRKHGVQKILCIASDYREYVREPEEDGLFCWASDAGPREFIALVRDAQAVCTDSFHGLALSIIFQKQFYIFERISPDAQLIANMARQENLLEKVGIEKRRLIKSVKELEALETIDYTKVRTSRFWDEAKSLVGSVVAQ